MIRKIEEVSGARIQFKEDCIFSVTGNKDVRMQSNAEKMMSDVIDKELVRISIIREPCLVSDTSSCHLEDANFFRGCYHTRDF